MGENYQVNIKLTKAFKTLIIMTEQEKNLIKKDLKVVRDREEVYERLKLVYKPIKARNLYNFFVAVQFDGLDTLKNRLSETSYYRNLKELKECKIDISQRYEIRDYENIISFNPFEWEEVS